MSRVASAMTPRSVVTAYGLLLLLPALTVAFAPCSHTSTTTAASRTGSSSTAAPITRKTLVSVQYHKNSDRAHIERTLEEMMDNDWRVFRAKLVAQEKVEIAEYQGRNQTSASSSSSSSSAAKSETHNDEKLTKQGQLSELFAGAISSIFQKKFNSNSNNSNNNSKQDTEKKSIFDGDSIGGVIAANVQSEDPFVSEAELPLLLQSKIKIDKHRWAHEIPHVERGCVLIANEKLGGVFHQTVVLVIQHSEKAGTIGVVINR